MSQDRQKWLFCAPAIIYMAIIFVLSSRPAPPFIQKWPILFGVKAAHLLEYGVLTGLWAFGLLRSTTWSLRRVLAWSVVLSFTWGITDEIHQSFVPGRTPSFADAFTNLIAALAWVALHQKLWKVSIRFRRLCGRL